jgi:hypothetical protein
MARVFISYRRDDSAGYARGLYDRLAARFGLDHVFMDLGIRPGENFIDRIHDGVGSCDVLIALIGRQWLSISGDDGRRRLDDPDDFPRIEIHTALERAHTRVIPVLVGGAQMPAVHELPGELQGLASRQALEIRDVSWDYDLDRLTEAIEAEAGQPSAPERTASAGQARPRYGRRRLIAGIGAGCVAVAAVVALVAGGGSSSGEDRMSEAAFRTKMDNLCRDYRARSDKYELPQLERGSPEVGRVLDRVEADVSSYARELRAIKPPANLETRFRQFTSYIVNGALTAVEYDRRYAREAPTTVQGDRAVQARNQHLVDEAKSKLVRAGKVRTELGLPGCIEVPLYGR